MLNNTTHLHGDAVFISDIGPQPADCNNPGSTLVCVTTNVYNPCSGGQYNNETNIGAEEVGEWLYSDNTPVPHHHSNLSDFITYEYTHQLRLARISDTQPPPLGVYTCKIQERSIGVYYNASIIIQESKFQRLLCIIGE